MSFRTSNPWKAAWLAVGTLVLLGALSFGISAGAKAFLVYSYLNDPLPFVGPDKQPLTRGKFIDLQIQAAAKSQPEAPTPVAPKE